MPDAALMLAAALPVVVACAWFGAGRALRRALAPERLAHHTDPAELGLSFTKHRIPGENGKSLHAWLVAPAAMAEMPARAAPAVIVMHGWGGNAAMMLPLARPLANAGFAALFLDARCHGLSDEDDFTSLPRFAADIQHAHAWLCRRPEVDAARIAFLGHSVGAGAALLAASRQAEIAAVVSISAFSHPVTMMRRWMAWRRIPQGLIGTGVLRWVERTIGHRFDDIAPLTTVSRVEAPVLLLHGEDDTVVPADEARQILAAGRPGRVRLVLLEGSHDRFAEPDAEAARIVEFLAAAFAARAHSPAD